MELLNRIYTKNIIMFFKVVIEYIVKIFSKISKYSVVFSIWVYLTVLEYLKKPSFYRNNAILILRLLILFIFFIFISQDFDTLVYTLWKKKRTLYLYKRVFCLYLDVYCDWVIFILLNMALLWHKVYSMLYEMLYTFIINILTRFNKNILNKKRNYVKIDKKARKEQIKLLENISAFIMILDLYFYYRFSSIGYVHSYLSILLVFLLLLISFLIYRLTNDLLWEEEKKIEIIYHILKGSSYALFFCAIILVLIKFGIFSYT